MFEHEQYEVILNRILSRVKSHYDKREGAIIFDGTAPVAFELAILYSTLDYILDETFGETASREHLLRRAAEYGIYPKPAGAAILKAECKGVFVPIGTVFKLEDTDLEYTVIEYFPIEDSGDIKYYAVQCDTVGTIGNKYFGNLLPMKYISGLEYAKIVGLLVPGEDEEDTEAFRARYEDEFLGRAFGGNRKDYINKVLSIAGVGALKITPVWNYDLDPESLIPGNAVDTWWQSAQNSLNSDVKFWINNVYTAAKKLWLTVGGTVKIVILDSNFNPATENLVRIVQTELDPEQNHGEGLGLAPIGHIVNVFAAGITLISVSAKFEAATEESDRIEREISQKIEEYFLNLSKSWGNITVKNEIKLPVEVKLSQIAAIILGISGVNDVDVSSILINGKAKNVTLPEDNIPRFVRFDRA